MRKLKLDAKSFTAAAVEVARKIEEAIKPDYTNSRYNDNPQALVVDMLIGQAALCAVMQANIDALAESDLIPKARVEPLRMGSRLVAQALHAALREQMKADGLMPVDADADAKASNVTPISAKLH